MTKTIMPAMILSGTLLLIDLIGAAAMMIAGKPHNAFVLIMLPIINASALIFVVGFITTVSEWKRIHTAPLKKIFYTITFPFFMLTYIPIALTALFSKKVEWEPIKHSKTLNFEDINDNASDQTQESIMTGAGAVTGTDNRDDG